LQPVEEANEPAGHCEHVVLPEVADEEPSPHEEHELWPALG
jgi:hypothetical protein